jgi:RNA polymerase sigma-70 factor (ECF subfamily)
MKETLHQPEEYLMLYHKMVMKNAYMYVKDYHTAEDITQETFIRLSENISKIEPNKVVRWLLLTSEHLALDYLKKGGKYETSPGLEENREEYTDVCSGDLSDRMVLMEEKEHRYRALQKLKKERPLWYDALLMSWVENMDNHAIGQKLGVKASLVSKWKERARSWLKKEYEKEYENIE